jgi:hypothetical protein
VRERLWPASAEGRWTTIVGVFVFLASLLVYAWCVTPTVPYWDSGEYIATSYILGIPHPPGTPLYVLIGRLFTFLPLGSIAVRVNLLSSLSSAVAVLFTFLITVRLARKNLAGDGSWWMPLAGGVVAAFFMAWGTTFWDNAIEAEVYASASAIMCFAIWLALLWWDGQGEPRNDRILWLILYVPLPGHRHSSRHLSWSSLHLPARHDGPLGARQQGRVLGDDRPFPGGHAGPHHGGIHHR